MSVRSSIESLGRLFSIVLALAIGEAFKQFVSDKAEKPEDRHIHWDRLCALVAFIILVVPFSHGMARYFHETYKEGARPNPYALYLSIDSVAFTVEAIFFFVLSRSLPRVQWRRFHLTVVCLLLVDILWGAFAAFSHAPRMWPWVFVNIIAVILLGIVLWAFSEKNSWHGLSFALLVVIARTAADYYTSQEFYFPPLP